MSTHWERVDAGRYAAQFHGHILQAIRKEGKYNPDERPYIAVVDKVPLEPGEWSLNRAKTKAMQHVMRQMNKAKAERVFQKPEPDKALQAVQAAIKPEGLNAVLEADLLFTPDPSLGVFHVQKVPPEPEPEPEPVQAPAGLVQTPPEPVQAAIKPEGLNAGTITPYPGQFVISGMILADDLLATLNTMKETLALIREHSDAECVVNMPPVLKL